MKNQKLALLGGVAAASTLFLAACGSSSNSSKGNNLQLRVWVQTLIP